jgi:hypothetical protein
VTSSLGSARRFALITTLVGIVGGVVAIIDSFTAGRTISWTYQTVLVLILGLWSRALLIFVALLLSGVTGALLVRPQLLNELRQSSWRMSRRSMALILVAITFQLFCTFVLTRVMYYDMLPSPEVFQLFPQAAESGPVSLRTYATNGRVQYVFKKAREPLDPERGEAELVFQTNGKTVDYNCGWVIFLLRGVDFRRFKELRFDIRGDRGDERIGVKAKDARGNEAGFVLDARYLREGAVTQHWQEAIVPFDDFGAVDFGLLENISLFATGDIAGTRLQKFVVGNFRFSY